MLPNIISFSIKFLNYDNLPDLMQGASMAVLTILISFAIGIFIHHLGDSHKKGNFLDLRVALDYVWFFIPSLVITGVMMILPFFMVANLDIKIFVFIFWLICFIAIFIILIRLYRWTKGNKNKFRLGYISKFPKSKTDQINSWSEIWSLKDNFNEIEFFVSFSKQIDLIIKDKEKSWEKVAKLLNGFFTNIDKRSNTLLMLHNEFFLKILEWHFNIWKLYYGEFSADYRGEVKITLNEHFIATEQTVDNIIRHINKEAITGNYRYPTHYFKYLEDHIKKYEYENIKGVEHTYNYIEKLPIYMDYFNLTPKSGEYKSIWSTYFPENWKITEKNYKDNYITRVWFKYIWSWLEDKIIEGEDEKWNKEVEDMLWSMFPEADPILWSKIVKFIIIYSTNSDIKNVVETKKNFGFAGRFFSGWGGNFEKDYAEFQKNQNKNTVRLAVLLFGKSIFTLKNINNYMGKINELEYEKDSNFDKEKMSLLSILELIKKEIENDKEL